MEEKRQHIVGVDIGGTFIDYVAISHGGQVRTHKELSDPGGLTDAFLRGLAVVAPAGTERLVHGTTVATNALLERKGVRTGLVTTAGFADVIAIGRQNRPELYALSGNRREPLVPQELRFEIGERVGADGQVVAPLDEASVKEVAKNLAEAGVEAVAVSLLFSFLHPEHELRTRSALEETLGDIPIFVSHVVLPEFREYERTTTTVVAAYVGPLVGRYIDRLDGRLDTEFQVMQSNGGVIDGIDAAHNGAALVLSGPAGGVVGAFEVAQSVGIDNVITFDMGGTSTDVAICPGEILHTTEAQIGDVPIRLPVIDIHTVGAGGGSIAKLDLAGVMRVGPESAGADPGPACYGRGTQPTVTDADLVLGRIPRDGFLGGSLQLDPERARVALERVGREMNLPVDEAALGVLRVVHVSMQRAIRRISVERGRDPRKFTLVAFGGAGPLHAAELAEELEIDRVLVPLYPGVESAMGMALADEIRDYSHTVKVRLVGDESLAQWWAPLHESARSQTSEDAEISRFADLRYVGQSHELRVPADDLSALRHEFEKAHQQMFGFVEEGRPVEMVNVRIRARTRHDIRLHHPDRDGTATSRSSTVRFADGWHETEILDRTTLASGREIEGPALVAQPDTATLIPPGWRAVVEESGNLLLVHRP